VKPGKSSLGSLLARRLKCQTKPIGLVLARRQHPSLHLTPFPHTSFRRIRRRQIGSVSHTRPLSDGTLDTSNLKLPANWLRFAESLTTETQRPQRNRAETRSTTRAEPFRRSLSLRDTPPPAGANRASQGMTSLLAEGLLTTFSRSSMARYSVPHLSYTNHLSPSTEIQIPSTDFFASRAGACP